MIELLKESLIDLIPWDKRVLLYSQDLEVIVEFTVWMHNRSGVLQDTLFLHKTIVCPCCLLCNKTVLIKLQS